MKNLMSVTKLLSIAMLMVVAVGCDLGDSTGTASGSALPFDPLAGNWTVGLGNTRPFGTDPLGAAASDPDTEPRNIAHELGNVVEILNFTFDEAAGTVTLTSTECDGSRTFELCFDEECDEGELPVPLIPLEDDNLIRGEIHGEWGPIESCNSENIESGVFEASFTIDPDCGSIRGIFESRVTLHFGDDSELLPIRKGRLAGARDGLPPVAPEPSLVNGTWIGGSDTFVFRNQGDRLIFEQLELSATLDFDQNGGVNIVLGGESICLDGADFGYTFRLDMDVDRFNKSGRGCIAGSFEIPETCDGSSVRGVLIANFNLSCGFSSLSETLESDDLILMFVGTPVEGPEFSAVVMGNRNTGAERERPKVADESTLVGDWIINLTGLASGDDDGDGFEDLDFVESEVVWFNMTEMLQEFSNAPSECSNLVGFPYSFNGGDVDFQYTVSGGWNLANTCEGNATDIGTLIYNIHYNPESDRISGTFSFDEHGTYVDSETNEVHSWSEIASGELAGHRVDCDD